MGEGGGERGGGSVAKNDLGSAKNLVFGRLEIFLAGFLAFWNGFLADYRCKSFWNAYKMGICVECRKVPKIQFLAIE